MQKYRKDESTKQKDGAILWHAKWMGGPSLAVIENCRWESLDGQPRITAYITGEPDTVFSQPAVCSYKGKRVRGYICAGRYYGDERDNTLVFRHCYF